MAMSEKELAATVAELQREVTFLRGIVVGQAEKLKALTKQAEERSLILKADSGWSHEGDGTRSGRSPAEIEDALANWKNEDHADDIYWHFDLFSRIHPDRASRWSCFAVADEGRRIYRLMFGDEVGDGSPLHSLFNGLADAGATGAFGAMAAALGVEADALETIITDHWLDREDGRRPAPLSGDRLVELCVELSSNANGGGWNARARRDLGITVNISAVDTR